MTDIMKKLILEYRENIEKAAEGHIKKVILFGSYARGDYKLDSDIDVMVLLDLDQDCMKEYENRIYDITYDFNCKNDTDIMPVVQNYAHFNYWKNAYMFYRNVEKEGVVI